MTRSARLKLMTAPCLTLMMLAPLLVSPTHSLDAPPMAVTVPVAHSSHTGLLV